MEHWRNDNWHGKAKVFGGQPGSVQLRPKIPNE